MVLWVLLTLKNFQKITISEKCCNNNNSDNPLTSRRTDGDKNGLRCAVCYRAASLSNLGYLADTKADIHFIWPQPHNSMYVHVSEPILARVNNFPKSKKRFTMEDQSSSFLVLVKLYSRLDRAYLSA